MYNFFIFNKIAIFLNTYESNPDSKNTGMEYLEEHCMENIDNSIYVPAFF